MQNMHTRCEGSSILSHVNFYVFDEFLNLFLNFPEKLLYREIGTTRKVSFHSYPWFRYSCSRRVYKKLNLTTHWITFPISDKSSVPSSI